MSYSCAWYASIDEVPREEWNSLRHGEDDLFMDPRFIAVVERGMADEGEFWCLLIRDESGRALASACVSLYRIDGAIFCHGLLRSWIEFLRRLWSGYLKFRVFFCGLPVSGGQSHLRFAPGADRRQVLQTLDEALCRMAAQRRVRLVVFKEFDEQERPATDSLGELGYLRAASLPMNCLDPRFRDFDDFCNTIRSHYRYKIRRSQKKFRQAGFRVEHFQGEAILPLYTDEVHRLYQAVVDQAETKLEMLPAEFFRQLVRQFPDDVHFLAVRKDDRIVAFAWGLRTANVYRNLFIGVDYAWNADTDLYFNLMIQDLDFALKQNVADIHVGQTADTFKSRLGCHGRPRWIYVKATRRLLSWCMRATAGWLFPPPQASPVRDLFRDAATTADEQPTAPP